VALLDRPLIPGLHFLGGSRHELASGYGRCSRRAASAGLHTRGGEAGIWSALRPGNTLGRDLLHDAITIPTCSQQFRDNKGVILVVGMFDIAGR
jgi:hypothetical protein